MFSKLLKTDSFKLSNNASYFQNVYIDNVKHNHASRIYKNEPSTILETFYFSLTVNNFTATKNWLDSTAAVFFGVLLRQIVKAEQIYSIIILHERALSATVNRPQSRNHCSGLTGLAKHKKHCLLIGSI